MAIQLKFCPFCGNDKISLSQLRDSTYSTITCNSCHIVVLSKTAHSAEALIQKWNARADDEV